MKDKLCKTPELVLLYLKLSFTLNTDSSKIALEKLVAISRPAENVSYFFPSNSFVPQ